MPKSPMGRQSNAPTVTLNKFTLNGSFRAKVVDFVGVLKLLARYKFKYIFK